MTKENFCAPCLLALPMAFAGASTLTSSSSSPSRVDEPEHTPTLFQNLMSWINSLSTLEWILLYVVLTILFFYPFKYIMMIIFTLLSGKDCKDCK